VLAGGAAARVGTRVPGGTDGWLVGVPEVLATVTPGVAPAVVFFPGGGPSCGAPPGEVAAGLVVAAVEPARAALVPPGVLIMAGGLVAGERLGTPLTEELPTAEPLTVEPPGVEPLGVEPLTFGLRTPGVCIGVVALRAVVAGATVPEMDGAAAVPVDLDGDVEVTCLRSEAVTVGVAALVGGAAELSNGSRRGGVAVAVLGASTPVRLGVVTPLTAAWLPVAGVPGFPLDRPATTKIAPIRTATAAMVTATRRSQ